MNDAESTPEGTLESPINNGQVLSERAPPHVEIGFSRAGIDNAAVAIRQNLEVLHGYGLDPRAKACALTKLDECLMWVERGLKAI